MIHTLWLNLKVGTVDVATLTEKKGTIKDTILIKASSQCTATRLEDGTVEVVGPQNLKVVLIGPDQSGIADVKGSHKLALEVDGGS